MVYQGDLQSLLLKERMTRFRSSHRVLGCLVDYLSLRRFSEHIVKSLMSNQ